MFQRNPIHRSLGIGACATAIVLCSTAARSDPRRTKVESACAAAQQSAQERERSGHLREARELLLSCAKSTCGKLLQQECKTRFTQLDSDDIPSIVPFVADDAGAPLADVQVRMDGELLTSRLDGQPLQVDPGMHEFSFSTDRGVFATQRILIAQGQRNRRVSALLHSADKGEPTKTPETPAPPPAPVETKAAHDKPAPDTKAPPKVAAEVASPEERPEGGRSALPYVLGGAGLAGVAAGTLFVVLGNTDTSSLPANVATGASVGVGVATLVVATWVLLSPRTTEERPPTRAAYAFDVRTAPSGAVASVSGAF